MAEIRHSISADDRRFRQTMDRVEKRGGESARGTERSWNRAGRGMADGVDRWAKRLISFAVAKKVFTEGRKALVDYTDRFPTLSREMQRTITGFDTLKVAASGALSHMLGFVDMGGIFNSLADTLNRMHVGLTARFSGGEAALKLLKRQREQDRLLQQTRRMEIDDASKMRNIEIMRLGDRKKQADLANLEMRMARERFAIEQAAFLTEDERADRLRELARQESQIADLIERNARQQERRDRSLGPGAALHRSLVRQVFGPGVNKPDEGRAAQRTRQRQLNEAQKQTRLLGRIAGGAVAG